MKSKIKWAALGGLVLSFMSLLVHLFLAKSSADLVQYSAIKAFSEDLQHANSAGVKGAGSRKLWGKVKALEPLQPYAKPRSSFPGNVCKSLFICLEITAPSTNKLNIIDYY
ncbi:protein EMBRYO SAC DEVELOPMENT ARREST 30-like [Olea europaea var. sylvestris]|uniref:protein EMBRYO SAC DEVELOPMENT ARREST 30-like n=1 Tax=Olea europaea var. sylvestris TaxID=158386 RepID=UPI000C1D51F8|nr:protein EMBRYO SAC DEVELOPMENT ARREST 30-like [Olea europaea var. sylvestris]XP_022882286.1 protein EMBRYO SAC DEVELOPMENT ARREST 30-like [Olea europaea var. sylvestris]XP_022882287.1 protein EMBRYO SAC DEVELOPMENT ARREST 30-like [Olea europaea var. sylvestris]